MSVILSSAANFYHYLNVEIADPRTQGWFLMKSPWPGLAILGVYLLLVLKCLPAYMSKRPAFELRSLLIVYNIIQIVGSGYVMYKSLALGWLNHYSLVCQPVDEGPHSIEYAWHACYGYFGLKLLDLLDTIFFVLRKKQNQVTFLHVYHHTGMIMVGWGMVKWVPGGHMTILVPVNSFVHMVMYFYYLLSTFDDTIKKSLWWKKYVTQLQMGQFLLLIVHSSVLLVTSEECTYPKPPVYLMVPQHVYVFILFALFYYKSYVKTKQA